MFSHLPSLQCITRIVGVKYDSPQMDFEKLMKQDEFQRCLFIFNDNFHDHFSAHRGGGNARVRCFNNYSTFRPPKSFGIPTGRSSGYKRLVDGQSDIDTCLAELIELLNTNDYDSLVYSVDSYGQPLIGSGIFQVGAEVKQYITTFILRVGLANTSEPCELVYLSKENEGIRPQLSSTRSCWRQWTRASCPCEQARALARV